MSRNSSSFDEVLESKPGDWKVERLGNLFAQRKEKKRPDIPLLAVTGTGGVVPRDSLERRDTSNADKSKYLRVCEGDIAYNTMRMWQGVSGLSSYEGIVSPAYTICRPKDGVSSTYMAQLFKLPELIQVFHRNSQGLVDDTLNLKFENFSPILVPVPPLAEQQKIAAILSSVDDVIEKTRAQISKLKDLKTGMMQELLTKGIGNTAFKDSPVGRIPEGWDVCMASEVADEVMVGVVIKPTQYYVDSGVPALRSANVRESGLTMENLKYFSRESNELLKKSKLKKGDLLTVRTGYPGTTAVVTDDFEGCNCIDVVITRPSERMNPDFFSLWVNSDNGKGQVLKAQGGLAQQHFNVGDMKNLLVAVPPLEEQKSIFNIVDSVTKKVSIAEIRLEQVVRAKKALMQDLLTGKVRVNVDNKENAVA